MEMYNFLIILRDVNAKTSSAHVRYAHDKRTNENDKCLVRRLVRSHSSS